MTPGSTIQRKTIDNLTPGHRKYLRGLQCNRWSSPSTRIERGEVGAALRGPGPVQGVRVHRPVAAAAGKRGKDASAARTGRTRPSGRRCTSTCSAPTTWWSSLTSTTSTTPATPRSSRPPSTTSTRRRSIGLTATPHESSTDKRVFHYPLSRGDRRRVRQDPGAGVPAGRHQRHAHPVGRRADAAGRQACRDAGLLRPDAEAAVRRAGPVRRRADHRRGQRVPRHARRAEHARRPRQDACWSPPRSRTRPSRCSTRSRTPTRTIRAVVSVSMLKEGWDVKNIYVIASVRAMESQLLTEQILGRGLRLPFGERTGNPMLDTVEVLSHHSFATLLKQAKVLLEETIGDRVDEATAVVNPTPGKHATGAPLTAHGELPVDVRPRPGRRGRDPATRGRRHRPRPTGPVREDEVEHADDPAEPRRHQAGHHGRPGRRRRAVPADPHSHPDPALARRSARSRCSSPRWSPVGPRPVLAHQGQPDQRRSARTSVRRRQRPHPDPQGARRPQGRRRDTPAW